MLRKYIIKRKSNEYQTHEENKYRCDVISNILLRTLTRNRRSLVGCSFHWVAQNVCQDHAGSAQRAPEIARDRPRVAPERRKSGPRAAQERSTSNQRAPMRRQERPKNAQECPKSAQEQPKRPDADTFRELLTDLGSFC